MAEDHKRSMNDKDVRPDGSIEFERREHDNGERSGVRNAD
jgi:hypothetical protein